MEFAKAVLSFGQYVESLPPEQREFFKAFNHDKPGWLTRFIDGVEWKLHIYRDNTNNPVMELWKDDEKCHSVAMTCCLACMVKDFYAFVWGHYQIMQSIAAGGKPNPNSPWARHG